jgi:hypothetical protein
MLRREATDEKLLEEAFWSADFNRVTGAQFGQA